MDRESKLENSNPLVAPGIAAAASLSPPVAALAQAAMPPSPRRAYAAALADLDAALGGAPLDDAALADYLGTRFLAGAAPSSLAVTVAAVRFLAKAGGAPPPTGPETAFVLKGIRREGANRGRGQVAGVQWAQADAAAALAANGGQGLAGLRDAALIAVVSDALLRVSEAAALRVADFEAQEDGSGRVLIARSKTDQEGEGAVLYLGPVTMRRVRSWTEAAGIGDGPMFRQIRRGGGREEAGLSSRSIREIIAGRGGGGGGGGSGSPACPAARSGRLSRRGAGKRGSTGACPAIRFGSERRSRLRRPAPGLSKCRRRDAGRLPPCPPAMRAVSSRRAARSPGSGTGHSRQRRRGASPHRLAARWTACGVTPTAWPTSA